jgi:hypothetical protein
VYTGIIAYGFVKVISTSRFNLTMVIQKKGSKEQTTLSDVLIMPDVWVNLLSLTKVLNSTKAY